MSFAKLCNRDVGHNLGTHNSLPFAVQSCFRCSEWSRLCRVRKAYVRAFGNATSHPDWMIRRWTRTFGHDATVALCQHNNAMPEYCLRVNTARASVAQVLQQLQGLGVEAVSCRFLPQHFIRQATLMNA
jgi:16S rRNA C967 or C1407 C5-methylase (RsmB/RsmF family)